MKLLRVVRSMDPSAGGISTGIREMHQPLRNNGFDVKILCFDDTDSPWSNDLNGDLICMGRINNKYGYRIGLLSEIRRIARRFDVAIVEGIWSYHSFACWRVFCAIGLPYFVYTHGMLDPWFKRTYPIKHLKKSAYWPWADYNVLRDAEAVFFTTEQERLLARDSFWLYKAKEKVVGYGTSPPPSDVRAQRIAFMERFPHLRGQRILLFLSRIHPKKGVDLLIEAFAAIAFSDPALQLVIAGPDQVDLQAGLQQRSAELGIADRISWPGMLSGDLKWGAYRSAELFCLPSHQENFGVVVAEALACGLPVAISEPVNIAADVAQAGAGIVHVDTALGTEEALRQWLAMTPMAKVEMAERGRQLFFERFDFASVAKNILPLLEEAVLEASRK
ncbi:putative alpha-glycosyltransferase/ family 4 [Synechococcus sp. ROS8604]|nr:putative alpha-glycosyltransferase/ family 4 [Synechococcus sp. ROS8604]